MSWAYVCGASRAPSPPNPAATPTGRTENAQRGTSMSLVYPIGRHLEFPISVFTKCDLGADPHRPTWRCAPKRTTHGSLRHGKGAGVGRRVRQVRPAWRTERPSALKPEKAGALTTG